MQLGSLSSQSAQPGLSVKTLSNLKIPLPPLPTQRKIASILSALDDKIELNRRMNENLEEQAKALFKEFDLSSMESGHIENIAIIKYGKNLPQKQLCKTGYEVFGGNGVIGYYHEYMYNHPMILVSCRGAASGKIIISHPYSYVTNNSLILELKDRDYFEFYKWFFLLNQLHSYATGSAQPQITIENIRSIEIPIPNLRSIQHIMSVLNSISNTIYNNERYSDGLTKTRDTLLPKLMRGEIDVENVLV